MRVRGIACRIRAPLAVRLSLGKPIFKGFLSPGHHLRNRGVKVAEFLPPGLQHGTNLVPDLRPLFRKWTN
jgi:hypothetical protein